MLFADTFTNYNHPELGRDAVTVLEALGYQVIVPRVKCCGRPMLSQGMMDRARANARANIDSIYPYIAQGARLVGLEPSCVSTFTDDYIDLLGGADDKADAVVRSTMLVEQFVQYAVEEEGAVLKLDGWNLSEKILLHGHCHQKALVGTRPAVELLNTIRGCETVEINSGCCGMAGAFGFEAEHYDVSQEIGEQGLFPAIRQQGGDFVVVAEGVSCRQQIEHGTGKRAMHLVEALAAAL